MFLRELFESAILLEATRGGQQVLANKNLVAGVADQLKDDISVPSAQRNAFRKMSDEQVAQWFVDKIEAVDRAGYQGITFARDGQFINWLAVNYSNGMDIWEDIEDVYPMAMNQYVALKNRRRPDGQPYLDPKHNDYQKFKGVKVLANYMITHYAGVLEQIEAAAKRSAADKKWRATARSVKIVDNEDYDIYILRNRAAAILFGKSCLYCTANENNEERFEMYSRTQPLFGLVPKKLPKLKDARAGVSAEPNIVQKFQFDANPRGHGDGGHEFKDYLNSNVPVSRVRETFPYLKYDIVQGLRANAEAIENNPDEVDKEGNPIPQKTYSVEDAIRKFTTEFAQYLTDKRRPAPKPEGEENPEAAPAETPPDNELPPV